MENDDIRKIVREELHTYLCSNVGTDFFGYNLNRLSWFKAGMESVDFMMENLYDTHQSDNRQRHLTYILSQAEKDGLFLEFGVGHQGESIKIIADSIDKKTVYGFDTFRGLPEKWGNVLPKGAFYNCGRPPETGRDNIVFVKGLFGDTLPGFMQEHGEPCAFINIDCDLYSSAKCVLDHLAGRITAGTVINFDEFFNYPGWQKHEFLAWNEFCAEHGVQFEYIGFVPNDMCLAVKVTAINSGF